MVQRPDQLFGRTPYCTLLHRHGADGGNPASAGLRAPHCPSIMPRPPHGQR